MGKKLSEAREGTELEKVFLTTKVSVMKWTVMTISIHLVRKQKEFPEECSVA
jgi:hypothetical protein